MNTWTDKYQDYKENHEQEVENLTGTFNVVQAPFSKLDKLQYECSLFVVHSI